MKHRTFFVAAALFAFAAAVAVVTLVNGYLKTEKIVVAARDIDANVVLTERDVRTETVSAKTVGRDVLKDPSGAVGKATDRPLPAGTPVCSGYLKPPLAAGAAGKLSAYPGTVAVSVPANADATVGGSIKAGDRVTVYALYKGGSPVVQQGQKALSPGSLEELAVNVPVLSVPSGNSPVGQGSAVTLAVSLEQASRILKARAAGAEIACVLLPLGKEE
ncbi:Flp pilus assembly protein CpaB [Thermodesulfitimonas autotrophica]|uniref:Flp pilus assembly protein CpaB n=1 Tax=Thermodesulfitimonas autotrophica TaxID=1894989 RepID=A0A3N5BUL7_9THEO|nr:Flp pilus assembly protein CpaB [Thermodesulfitimonas autotrophica]RPF49585.1 Flp pilus assembly protein CpaB [Thermodesulfitimonas autotrophica]